MATSSITITALTATPTLRGNKIAAAVSATGPAANIPTLMLAAVEFFASITNDFTTATKVVEGNPEAFHAGLIEEQIYYYWAKPRAVNGSYGAVFPVSPTGGVACTAIGLSGLAFGLANGKIVVDVNSTDPTVTAGSVRLSLKTNAGADASATDPIFLAFRSATASAGNYQIRQLTSALSLTYASGGGAPPLANVPFRLWWGIIDDGGTERLWISRRSGDGNVFALPEQGVASSVTDGGAATLITPGVTVTSKAFRILGYLDWTAGLPVGGNFSIGPDVVRAYGSGVALPGAILQCLESNLATKSTGTTVVPYDDTIPQRGESDSYFTYSITPSSMCNQLEHRVTLMCSHSAAGANPIALCVHYQSGFGPTADAIACSIGTPPAADKPIPISVSFIQSIPQTGQLGYRIQAAGTTAGTLTVNGAAGNRLFGGALNSHYSLTEYQG